MAERFILASGSPRRRELLEDAGYVFDIVVPNVAEAANHPLTLRELTALNATRKAAAVSRRLPAAIVLAADTLVSLHGRIIGKPADRARAAKILRSLSGRVHEVCSAVAIWSAGWRFTSFNVVSRVHFRTLTPQQIDSYIRKIDPLDKAGAYAAQRDGREIIARIEGSYTNVVGLPMEETMRALAALGVRPRRNQRDAMTAASSRAGSGSGDLSRRRTR